MRLVAMRDWLEKIPEYINKNWELLLKRVIVISFLLFLCLFTISVVKAISQADQIFENGDKIEMFIPCLNDSITILNNSESVEYIKETKLRNILDQYSTWTYNSKNCYSVNFQTKNNLKNLRKDVYNLEKEYLVNSLKQAPISKRKIILELPYTWKLLKPEFWEWALSVFLFFLVIFLMSKAYKMKDINKHDEDDNDNDNKFSEMQKKYKLHELFCRDFSSLSYDTATHSNRAEVSEYSGLLHWNRDAGEKLLSIFLVLSFVIFIVRIVRYLFFFAIGDIWYFTLIPIEINIILSIIGFGLIIDGIIIVSAMTDAPGISKTLDSIIVVLAGVVILLVEASPGDYSFVKFSLGNEIDSWITICISLVIAILFIVRWIVRHHTVNDWKGKETSNDPCYRRNKVFHMCYNRNCSRPRRSK